MRKPKLTLVLLALATLLGLCTPPVHAQTIIKDSNGQLSAACSYLDANNISNFCGSNSPLPMFTSTPATADQELYGLGRNWFASPTPITTGTEPVGAFFVDNFTVVGWSRSGVATQQMRSTDGGRTYVNVGATQATTNGAEGAVLATNGNYILGQRSTFILVTNGFTFTSSTMTGTGPEVPRALVTSSGGTILTVGDSFPAAGTGTVCRSTNFGVTFNCAAPAAMATNPFGNFGSMRLANVSGLIWLAVGETGGNTVLFRSTDDGVTWTQITTFAQGTGPSGVSCLTSLICLWANGQNIFRSADAGLTWGTAILTSGDANTQLAAFAVYNSTIAVALSSTASTPVFYRTSDAGLHWTPITSTACPGAGSIPPRVATGQNVKQSRAIYWCSSTIGTGNIQYSPSLGTNAAILTGANGQQGTITPNGEVVVGGSGTAGTPSTAIVTIQGIAGATPQIQVPTQGATLFNTQATSGANTAQTLSVTGAAAQRATLRGAWGSISAAGSCTVIIQDGATTILTLPPLTSVTPAVVSLFPNGAVPASGITVTAANNVNVVIGACGAAVTSTVAISGDRQ